MKATVATNVQDLEQILTLQRSNLIASLSPAEWQDQGFVTVEHTLDVLQQMHDAAPSIIIKDDGRVVAYALTMLRECRNMVPILEPMFANLDALQWKNKPLSDHRFYVMGQICVAKEYRGQGLFDRLYEKHREVCSPQYDFLVTEIATRNTRSMRAHERVGFKTIHTYRDDLDHWAVVIWDWHHMA